MNPLRTFALVVAGLFVVLTFLLWQGTAPDPSRNDRTLDALRRVMLHSAAVQRDVLQARGGLLSSYDPFVRSMGKLRTATADLTTAREVARGEARGDIDRKIAEVAAAVRDQELLVEAFKSDNALLRNSLAYFIHMSGQLATATGRLPAADVGALTMAMLHFVDEPRPDAGAEVTAALDRLARQPDDAVGAVDLNSLISHGRLIVATLPEVDGLVARIQASPTAERARVLQNAYLDAHGRAAARAGTFRVLLYIAALTLVAYVAYLFLRLRENARILRRRVELEALIASISTEFINLSRGGIRDNISKALARLVEHAGLDDAQIVVHRDGEADLRGSYAFRKPAATAPAPEPEQVLELALGWSLEGYEHQGCVYVPDVEALPESPEKASLRARDIRSWLCIPMWLAGERLGFIALGAVTREMRLLEDDIALLRTAAEIFANAIARERSEAEREALQARLNQSQRLEAIGTLAGGIAHEFNNILAVIIGYGEMALPSLRRDSPARRHLLQILKAGERAREVIDQVLAFGRRRERRHLPLRVEPIIEDTIELLRASLPATVNMSTRLMAGSASMLGDPTEVQQVVMNLCTNAAQAMNGRGALELEIDAVDAGDELTLSHGSLPGGRYIRLVVRDTGSGMDPATVERVFEPFFTTKPAGEGTGLGLSIVHGIVAEHGGAVDVRSRPGEGTTFTVYFPRMNGIAERVHEAPETRAPRGHGETILVVDDDKSLVRLSEEMLAAQGYVAVGFDSSRAALTAFHADPRRFDLVLTDEVMPEMTGTELATAVHEVRPDLPILLMTGHERQLRSNRLRAAGIREVLRKPILSQPMAAGVARQLSSRGKAAHAAGRY